MRYIYIYGIKFRILEMRENEIALRKLSDGTARFAPHKEHWLGL